MSTAHHTHPTTEPSATWTCPMHPEVTSDQPGSCPKCGMYLEPVDGGDPSPAVHEHTEHAPTHPDATRQPSDTGHAPDPTGAGQRKYTCPMHPEIIRDEPGACPICGMALEPVMAGLDDGPNVELVDMRRRFTLAAVLSAVVVVLAMAPHLLPQIDQVLPARTSQWLQLALSVPVVWWAGWPFFQRGARSLVSRHLNMFTLVALGVAMSWGYSVVAVAAPDLFPAAMHEAPGTVGVYFEAAAVIVTLVLLGQVLELRARDQTSGAIRSLLDLSPTTAHLVTADDTTRDVEVADLAPGDLVRILPGEKISVDGTVAEGSCYVDESMITGEPVPVEKKAGDHVTGGTIATGGTIVVEATELGADSMVARIVDLVAQAQRSRAPIQGLVDRISAWFVPIVIAIAAAAFITWLLVGPQPRLPYAIVVFVSVLIIACPCALGLATPMSIMVGIGRGATEGVLVRNAEALERLEKVDTLVVDKTGTLTQGHPSLVRQQAAAGHDPAEVLRLGASIEANSEHPLAHAVAAAAKDGHLRLAAVDDFTAHPGGGVGGTVEGKHLLIGSVAFVEAQGITTHALRDEVEGVRRDGATAVLVAVDGELVGLWGIADPIKPTTQQAITDLRQRGIDVVMLTGDNQVTARAIADQLGIDQVIADVLPDQKHQVVEQLKRAGHVVAMAGDGVNDAPALAAADVGIAMGTGSDVAIESAHVTLLGGDLAGLVRARDLSSATMRNVRQNLVFAFAYNVLGIPVAAGILYPATGMLLSPVIAAAAMALSSVSVITNSLRIRRLQA